MPGEVGEFVLLSEPLPIVHGDGDCDSLGGRSLLCELHVKEARVSVTFDYDFTETSACSPTIFTGCIAQFNVYDVGAGKPVKLFSIPAPAGAHTLTKDIVGKSQPRRSGAENTCWP